MNDQTKSYNLNVTFYKAVAVFALVVAIVMGYVAYQKNSADTAGAAESRVRVGDDVATMRTGATTTPSGAPTAFLLAGRATSTLMFESENFNALAVELQWIGTSTPKSGTLEINLYSCGNGVDCYPYDMGISTLTNNIASALSVSSSSPVILWRPVETVGTSTKSIKLPFIPAKKTKITFGLNASSTESIGFSANVVGQIDGTR